MIKHLVCLLLYYSSCYDFVRNNSGSNTINVCLLNLIISLSEAFTSTHIRDSLIKFPLEVILCEMIFPLRNYIKTLLEKCSRGIIKGSKRSSFNPNENLILALPTNIYIFSSPATTFITSSAFVHV